MPTCWAAFFEMKPIKRKYLRNGDLVEIKLPRLNGYVCAKIIDPMKSKSPIELPFFIRLFNHHYSDPRIDSFEHSQDLLVDPFWISGQSAAVTKYGWRILTNEDVNDKEFFFSDTKSQWPPFIDNYDYWVYFKNFDAMPIRSDYDKVSHLNFKSGKDISFVPLIAEIELLKILNKDYKDLFGIMDFLEESIYTEYSSLPVYSRLSEEIKGKHIRE